MSAHRMARLRAWKPLTCLLLLGALAAPAEADGEVLVKRFRIADVKPHLELSKVEKDGYEVEVGKRWTDSNGDNFFVFTHSTHDDNEGASLRGHLHAGKQGTFRRVRLIREDHPVESMDCHGDGRVHLKKGSVSLTDLDKDGVAELTFGYYANSLRKGGRCLLRFKLLVLEGPDKYILRGLVRHPEYGEGGNFRAEPSAQKWPRGTYEHAKQMWKKHAVLPSNYRPIAVPIAKAWDQKTVAKAAASRNKRRCTTWLARAGKTTARRATEDRICALYWLVHAGYGGDVKGREYIPRPYFGHHRFVAMRAASLLGLAERALATCELRCRNDDVEGPEESAATMFRLAAVTKFTLAGALHGVELAPYFEKVLSGKRLALSQGIIEDSSGIRLSLPDMHKLLHAVYARHGKRFDDPDLAALFYEATPPLLEKYASAHFPDALKKRRAFGKFPLKVDPGYRDSRLTAIDRQNIADLEKSIAQQVPR